MYIYFSICRVTKALQKKKYRKKFDISFVFYYLFKLFDITKSSFESALAERLVLFIFSPRFLSRFKFSLCEALSLILADSLAACLFLVCSAIMLSLCSKILPDASGIGFLYFSLHAEIRNGFLPQFI